MSFGDEADLQGVDSLLQSLLNAIQGRAAAEEEQKRENPTPQELIDALPYIRNCPSQKACPICQESTTAGEVMLQLPCEHAFHQGCIVPWLKQQCTCPICRAEITAATVKAASAAKETTLSFEELTKLPVKEVKRQLRELNIDHRHALEKKELVKLLFEATPDTATPCSPLATARLA